MTATATVTLAQLPARGWTRLPAENAIECNVENVGGGMCIKLGTWFHPQRNLRGRPVCAQHAKMRERDHR